MPTIVPITGNLNIPDLNLALGVVPPVAGAPPNPAPAAAQVAAGAAAPAAAGQPAQAAAVVPAGNPAPPQNNNGWPGWLVPAAAIIALAALAILAVAWGLSQIPNRRTIVEYSHENSGGVVDRQTVNPPDVPVLHIKQPGNELRIPVLGNGNVIVNNVVGGGHREQSKQAALEPKQERHEQKYSPRPAQPKKVSPPAPKKQESDDCCPPGQKCLPGANFEGDPDQGRIEESVYRQQTRPEGWAQVAYSPELASRQHRTEADQRTRRGRVDLARKW